MKFYPSRLIPSIADLERSISVSAVSGGAQRKGRPSQREKIWRRRATFMATLVCVPFGYGAEKASLSQHPSVGQHLVPADVNWDHPVYETTFDDASILQDWRLEGGKRMSIEGGNLVLESEEGQSSNHLVAWLNKEMPADFLLEFTVRPLNRRRGLNIIFFSTRGSGGESIFDPSLAPRTGVFRQYHSSDLNGYHISYWAGSRGKANIRKNAGFKLVAAGPDRIMDAAPDALQVVRVYKRGGTIRLIVDDIVSAAWDDDGRTHGPVWDHRGWIGLRQMGHTVRCEYGYLKVFPCKR